jgi:glycosyltransferase involved in cell wall biosynthesis
VNRVIVTSPVWSLNGVNVFCANLVRGLRERGVDARLLLTHPRQPDLKPLPLPVDIPIEDLGAERSSARDRRLELLVRYLGDSAPCIYLPNHDFEHSPVCTRLARGIQVVPIIHGHERMHYSRAARLGRYTDTIVAVSDQTWREFRSLQPSLAGKLKLIPYGVKVPASPSPVRALSNHLLELIYSGRIVTGQKRIMDLARIAAGLSEREIPFRLTIAGGGADQEELRHRLEPLVRSGQVYFAGIVDGERLAGLYARSHAVLLTSRFEGLPLCLLEGMGHGCVPIVPAIPSLTPSPVMDGRNGCVFDIGDIPRCVERCVHLYRHPEILSALSLNAIATVEKRFSHEAMLAAYLGVFEAAGTR